MSACRIFPVQSRLMTGYWESLWFWDHIQQDWLWTRRGVYPFFFSDGRKTWLYYGRGGSPEKRHFYD